MRSKQTTTKSPSKVVSPMASQSAIAQITDSARRGELVVVIGSGVSMALTNGKIPALSWTGLIRDGFAFGVKKGKISPAQNKNWETQLGSNDIDDLLCAAEFMGRKLDAPQGDLYARWLEHVFKSVQPTNPKMRRALSTLHKAGIPICTLNYDPLLERITGLNAINLSEGAKVTSWMRRESPGILHLHGSWDAPVTCILGIRDYEATLTNDVRELIQRGLGSFRRLLFLGCGDTFADPNFTSLIKWLRGKMKTATLDHYALVSDGEVAARNADPAWHGFVEPVGYGERHADLPAFLLKHFPAPKAAVARKRAGLGKALASTSEHARLIADYRTFLLRDCGQMTIEGVRADMDIGQRKFDIERLFVPLKVLPCPPEIPDTDPKREEKILKWNEKNKKPRSFGSVFAKRSRLALLALPGGGKTLLLKRLAVAYAHPSRRRASEDALPDLDVTPVLIRCREWREHIQNPILTILQKLPDISGDARLAGLSDALLPLFKKGRILLLVDGLDEIHNDAHRSVFVEHLEAFLEEYKLTRLIVTSREAGFSLVAPCVARFCERWRVAPLEEDAIIALCDHWQLLMAGDSPQAQAEGREVAQYLLRNTSLRRLAENPLLLTMLLVVKHGAGRLPPDRVSLYSRAVEVLLDTWNIKGHDPLNPKEAVPQLAYVAFEMMRIGKQTATEKELLAVLEQARDNVPQIRRYAKDTPYEFLKRVELRSSLLLEAGHQVEAGRTVPFYQFRHLTFQEYLAAVAAAEGHYVGYGKSDTVLTPLARHLTAEEWKEVIPMAAVLARKQAEPLMAALVTETSRLRAKIEGGKELPPDRTWSGPRGPRLPPSVARLVQCLVEEVEAAPETLTTALQLTAFFASGCSSEEDWMALARGPYGDELLHQAWLLYAPMQWSEATEILTTYAQLAAMRLPHTYWRSTEGESELKRLLVSEDPEEIARGCFTCASLQGPVHPEHSDRPTDTAIQPMGELVHHLFADEPALQVAAVYALAHIWHYRGQREYPQSTPAVLSRLLSLRLHGTHSVLVTWSGMAMAEQTGLPRNVWMPTLTEVEAQQIQKTVDRKKQEARNGYTILGDLIVAFHAGNGVVLSEDELAERLAEARKSRVYIAAGSEDPIKGMLEQMGETGQKHITPSKSRRKQPK